MRTGLKNICPDIPAEKWVSFESQGQAAVGLPAARDLLAAHPDAKKMAVVGLNDGGVLALIQAAEQLGRADEVIGWGQDGAFITGDNVNPHLAGSVFYFLEGYAVYAIRDVIKPIADGNPPPLKADAGDPASRVEPCPVSGRAGGEGARHGRAGEAAARGARGHHRVRAVLPEQVSLFGDGPRRPPARP